MSKHPSIVRVPRLVGIYEISKIAGMSKPTVISWRERYDDFPTSVAELKCGPIFLKSDIEVWLAKHKGPESKKKRGRRAQPA